MKEEYGWWLPYIDRMPEYVGSWRDVVDRLWEYRINPPDNIAPVVIRRSKDVTIIGAQKENFVENCSLGVIEAIATARRYAETHISTYRNTYFYIGAEPNNPSVPTGFRFVVTVYI